MKRPHHRRLSFVRLQSSRLCRGNYIFCISIDNIHPARRDPTPRVTSVEQLMRLVIEWRRGANELKCCESRKSRYPRNHDDNRSGEEDVTVYLSVCLPTYNYYTTKDDVYADGREENMICCRDVDDSFRCCLK